MRRIVWTEEAVGNLEAIVSYISAFNPEAARALAARLIEVADSLAEFSDRGRDAGEGRREMTIVQPYILRYRVTGDTVFILRIRHGARDRWKPRHPSLEPGFRFLKAVCQKAGPPGQTRGNDPKAIRGNR